jgi:endogenous inhibitor of DNA gyrase (YacG/DUF329 family)
MTGSVACEYCGNPVQREHAVVETEEDWSHYFCSETCQIAWHEQSDLEAEEDV